MSGDVVRWRIVQRASGIWRESFRGSLFTRHSDDDVLVLATDHDADVAAAREEGWNAGLDDPETRARIIEVLTDEGADSEGGWHSWRCFDKVRYAGPCGCTPAVADLVIAALRKPVGGGDGDL